MLKFTNYINKFQIGNRVKTIKITGNEEKSEYIGMKGTITSTFIGHKTGKKLYIINGICGSGFYIEELEHTK